jgi:hypothetical protein
MENNNINYPLENDTGKKKNNLSIIVIAIIVLIVIIVVVLRNNNRIQVEPNKEELPQFRQTDTELNKAASSDTTAVINSNLDNINVDDTSDADLGGVDQELNKL